MSALKFGMIRTSDIQPGFAFKNPAKAKNVYVVTERIGDPGLCEGGSQREGWTELRFKTDRYEAQSGGFYLKKAECPTPVTFYADGTNKFYDSVVITRKDKSKNGDKIWIEA